MALLNTPLNLTRPTNIAAAAFAPPNIPTGTLTPQGIKPGVGQQNSNALYGDFLGNTGTPLSAPKVKAPTPQQVAAATANNGSYNNQTGQVGAPGTYGASPSAAFAPNGSPLQDPGNNMVNPGYGEQAALYTQNRLLEDPSAGLLQDQYNQANQGTTGGNYLNQNLGTLNGPGQGDQYWNQVQGQFNQPFAGEQFTREATQNMAPTGPAGAFYGQAMGQYGDFTGYTGPQNAQGQYGQSSASLAGGSQGEQGLGQIAGQYNDIGRYTDPNLAAGQYAQTQGAFGDLPIAEFDPFYDRARQLGVQAYNQDAAGRGVYGSSEALSGVGNIITDIEAQRANRSFDAEMQRAQEQRARQQLLGEQARMGDLSSQAAFGANLAGAETFGNLNNMQANQELNRNQLLGNMANAADTQALGAQNANISGLSAFGNLAGQADTAETNRFNARTGAMNQADINATNRLRTGADIANQVDQNARENYTAQANAAYQSGNLQQSGTRLGADIAQQLSANDLARLNSFNQTAQGAEGQRQSRQNAQIDAQMRQTDQLLNSLGTDLNSLIGGSQADFEQQWESDLLPAMQAAGYSQQQIQQLHDDIGALVKKAV